MVPMAHPHDFALCLPLSTGGVLLGGGAEKPLGIGQTYAIEIYDPATHSFGHYGCLDTKRMYACGVETDIPLLHDYRLIYPHTQFQSEECCISEHSEDSEHYSHLLPFIDSLGQIAVCHTQGTDFQLLPTTTAIPTKGPWGRIGYSNSLLVDRKTAFPPR